MYIKIEHKDKIETHNACSYYGNHLDNYGLDFNVQTVDGRFVQRHYDDIREVDIYVMNEQGKTIDRL